MRNVVFKYLAAAVACMPLLAATSRADVLLDETDLIGLPTVALPSEHSFVVTDAQALTVTLTDFAVPAAFGSLQVAVTLGGTLVGSASVDATTHTATLPVPGAAGNYVLRVIGTPDTAQGFGSFGVCVAPASDATACVAAYSFSGNIQTPASISTSGTSTLNTNFVSTVAGTYTVTLTDDAFPAATQSLSAGIFQGSSPISVGIPAGTPTSVTLAATTNYALLVAAVADATLQAGLYGIRITDPNGTILFDRTLPVGTMPASSIVNLSSPQTLSATLNDFAYPAALAQAGVAVTQGSASLAQLAAPGTTPSFSAPKGSVEIWQYAVAGAQPGVYGLNVAAGTAAVFSNTEVVNPSPAASQQSFAFAVNLTAAGTYNLVTHDFQFPATLQSVTATVAQNGAVLTQASNGDFTAAAGYVIVVVDAMPPQSGNGIFGVTVQTSGASPQVLFDQTQAVGGVFLTRSVTYGGSGSYDVTLTDLGFPALFGNLAVAISRGSELLGKIYGGGVVKFSGTPGQYLFTIVASPNSTGLASTQNYGLYSIHVASSAPTVTLTAGASTVKAGDPVQLTWSTQDATACTAGGSSAWTGDQPLSGTTAVVISATATLTLTCTGPGGSGAQSVTVTATPAPASSGGGGGGGGLDLAFLAALGVWVFVRRHIRPAVNVAQM